jgi:hypothetical protein
VDPRTIAGGAASHLDGLALRGSGSASATKLARAGAAYKSAAQRFAAASAKNVLARPGLGAGGALGAA